MSRASEAVLLKDHLKELRLPTMRRDYAECARQARETRASYEGFLLDLVSRQLEQRRANQLERRLHNWHSRVCRHPGLASALS